MLNRRTFVQSAVKTATIAAAASRLNPLIAQSASLPQPKSPNDVIQLALIGAGIQGQGDTRTALQVPGVKLVAVADCYDGRLAHCKELWGGPSGNDLFTTRDYREILARNDVDAVLIAAQPGTGKSEECRLSQDHSTDVTLGRADSHSQANLPLTLTDCIRD